MALPEHQHQQHQGEGMPTSWRKNNSAPNKRHSSAPPQRQRTTTRTVPHVRQPSTSDHQHEGQDSATMAPFASTAAPTPTVGAGRDGPMSFPTPKFSAALKEVEDDTFTLISQATKRRWRAVNSSRECQFGEVLRAVELTGEVTAPPTYVAIKVRLGIFSNRYATVVRVFGSIVNYILCILRIFFWVVLRAELPQVCRVCLYSRRHDTKDTVSFLEWD